MKFFKRNFLYLFDKTIRAFLIFYLAFLFWALLISLGGGSLQDEVINALMDSGFFESLKTYEPPLLTFFLIFFPSYIISSSLIRDHRENGGLIMIKSKDVMTYFNSKVFSSFLYILILVSIFSLTLLIFFMVEGLYISLSTFFRMAMSFVLVIFIGASLAFFLSFYIADYLSLAIEALVLFSSSLLQSPYILGAQVLLGLQDFMDPIRGFSAQMNFIVLIDYFLFIVLFANLFLIKKSFWS